MRWKFEAWGGSLWLESWEVMYIYKVAWDDNTHLKITDHLSIFIPHALSLFFWSATILVSSGDVNNNIIFLIISLFSLSFSLSLSHCLLLYLPLLLSEVAGHGCMRATQGSWVCKRRQSTTTTISIIIILLPLSSWSQRSSSGQRRWHRAAGIGVSIFHVNLN